MNKLTDSVKLFIECICRCPIKFSGGFVIVVGAVVVVVITVAVVVSAARVAAAAASGATWAATVIVNVVVAVVVMISLFSDNMESRIISAKQNFWPHVYMNNNNSNLLLAVAREAGAQRAHADVIQWKHFPHCWLFVKGVHRSAVDYPHEGQWRGALMFYLMCAWTHGWTKSPVAGNFRRHGTHCDVTVMVIDRIKTRIIADVGFGHGFIRLNPIITFMTVAYLKKIHISINSFGNV